MNTYFEEIYFRIHRFCIIAVILSIFLKFQIKMFLFIENYIPSQTFIKDYLN